MKIAFILGRHKDDAIGGAEIQSSYLMEYFKKEGHEPIYICYGDKTNLEPEETLEGVKLYRIKKPWKGFKQTQYWDKSSLYKLLDREKPDILYQRGDFHFSDLISRYGNKRGIPVVSAISMERHCQKVKIHYNHLLPLDLLDIYLRGSYFKKSTQILSQTEHQKRELKKNYGVESIVIPNAHPIPEGPFVKNNNFQIIWVANIKPVKRPNLFVELARRMVDTNAHFVMVGRPAKGKLQEEIDSAVDELGSLEYLGQVDPDETNRLIAKSLVLVNTSESEGFSNTFIQAWLRKTLVISMNTDPGDVLKNKSMGYLEPAIDGLEKRLRKLLDNPEKTELIVEKARKYSREKYDIEVVGKRYLDLFDKLMKASG